MSSRRRVVITGLGIVSPVGSSLDLAWSNILAGKSGIVPITKYDVSLYTTRFAGLVSEDFKPESAMGPKELRKTDPFIHYGVAACKQALADAGIEITEANRERIGVLVGSGIGGIGKIEDEVESLHKGGPKKVSPFFVPGSIINMVSGYASIEMGIAGPSFATVSACTTAAHSIGVAARLIQAGDCDICLAGGAEAGSSPAGMAGFCQARALSTRNDDPQRASRPWDKDRDGFVLGDGAGVLVLEDYEQATARGARIYAELIGFGMSSDAYHITLPPDDGNGARRAMVNTLKDARINPEQVDYVNAHGTSTPAGDIAETMAMKGAFGDHARKLAVSSTKSMTGHLLGAAGGIEAVFCCLALRDQVIPPTINLDNPGEGCDLDYVPHTARQAKLDIVLSNSFGFGGTNGSLAFAKLK
ncbi:3-oxoacyl-[acyl-carrier-protein] synthase II [Panacagrimonas perspica]|uniref:3-oxoacyl-[acyl-carrier-protein] synthase 2 n=1 Tax=Panacagrimonas perspica TaxID=381431 RepID=A0A4S3K501_9GAMM|nr:beta-ketoacyl-ACP synthase II [Panacagrimonas perspica]TDU31595.1 3-oxoacyl-[acyl-carrier-protein] synthase II [Panacagrimonas perspica]THD03177.1 beta-ketoacyl-[acyl-carrier-protein] synthase II [Panacagrimonas perspica]